MKYIYSTSQMPKLSLTLYTFINIASSDKIDDRLIIKIKWSKNCNGNLNEIKEIMKP